ncbi:D-alanyl-D-alanine carboxypeptidase [Oryzifoliimicrobium ureilyticus]|uniref:D-alanyl-D-alanine carboxypeptidase n=1 Tax=Oryzifoliimicrobium ureilyticus TaxID=3113724 RepID=UPI0030761800
MRKLLAALMTAAMTIAAPVMASAGSASLILDARNGRILASENADAINHPASLTKMMTIYMAFDAMKRGKLGWNTPITVSKYAATRPPTKLGLKPGGTVTVREAILGMITKSANDAATALGEKLGGSESDFARLMTQKARSLGMTRTVFVNASGLPDNRQVTTARDMSTLAVALMRDFPSEYRLFSTESFNFRGRTIHGHNNLMYRYRGMDGIKTGYTNASGFNLVSAVRDGNRRVIGVVMGGRTARSRDAYMASLLDRYMSRASAGSSLVASVGGRRTVEVASAAEDSDVPMPVVAPRLEETTTSPQPKALGYLSTAAIPQGTVPLDRPADLPEIASAKPFAAVDSDATGSLSSVAGWQIQISAAPSEDAAHALLSQAQSEGGAALKSASPFTQSVGSGSRKIYRARFVGFKSREAANTACEALKRRSYDCMLLPSKG